MTEAILTLPAHLRRRLADLLASGTLPAPCPESVLRGRLGIQEGAAAVVAALDSLVAMGLSGPACATWIRSVEVAAARAPRPDLVWSGPEVPGVHARDTRAVFEELLSGAERSIWASSYAYFDGQKAFKVLAQRMDAHPSLEVTLLLNIERKWGNTTIADDIVHQFAERLWTKDWPGMRRPRVFYDPRALELEKPAGVLHAKAVVVDEEAVFITSANMTEAALDRNIELGLLTRDRALALSVVSHFRALIETKLLARLPGT